MARIRTVKPEFWTDERIGQCSMPARLLFIASWNFADDHGGIGRSAKQLKAQAFPYDAIECEPLIQELLEAGLVIEYAVEGKTYLHIKNFQKHQRQDNVAAPRFPLYREESRVLASARENVREIASNGEDSHGSRGNSALLLEGNGREGKGSRESRVLAHPRARQVPESFQITEAMRAWAAREAPESDVDRETALFRDHEFKDPHSNWPAAWRKWMRRAPEFKSRRRKDLPWGDGIPPKSVEQLEAEEAARAKS